MHIWNLCALALAGLLFGCTAAPTNVRPVLTILSPVDGARITIGQPVNILISAASSNNITKVEIQTEGNLVGTLGNEPPQSTFSGRLVYTPSRIGIAQLSAIAFDSLGGTSETFRLQLIVEPLLQPVDLNLGNIPVANATASPKGRDLPQACVWNSSFVSDVSIPDHTVIHGGDGFVKTWRLKNGSSCDWPDGFEIYFVSGDKMSALASGPVLPSRRGDTVDVSMGFLAPRSNGDYTSIWQLRAADGKAFGTKFYVTIKVTDQ